LAGFSYFWGARALPSAARVRGQTYESYRVAIGRFGVDHTAFPQGKRVAVSYDPDDPAEAVLLPGIHWPSVLLVLGIVGFAVGIPYYLWLHM